MRSCSPSRRRCNAPGMHSSWPCEPARRAPIGSGRSIAQIRAEQAAAAAAAAAHGQRQLPSAPGLARAQSGGWAIPWRDRRLRVGRAEPAAQQRRGIGLLPDHPRRPGALFGGTGPAAYLTSKAEQDAVATRIWNGGAGASDWVCAGDRRNPLTQLPQRRRFVASLTAHPAGRANLPRVTKSRTAPAVAGRAILLIALVVRVAYVEQTSYRAINDAGSYNRLGGMIARTGDYDIGSKPGSGAGGARGPTAYFPPGFPVLPRRRRPARRPPGGRQDRDRARADRQAAIGTVASR